MSSFDDKNFEIGEVTFEVEKLPAMHGLDVFERLRQDLSVAFGSDSLTNLFIGGDTDDTVGNALVMGQIIDLLMRIPATTITYLREQLFQTVRFHAPHHPGAGNVVLAGKEDEAFTEPLDIYEVLARCLMINFGNSVRRSASRWGSLINAMGTPR